MNKEYRRAAIIPAFYNFIRCGKFVLIFVSPKLNRYYSKNLFNFNYKKFKVMKKKIKDWIAFGYIENKKYKEDNLHEHKNMIMLHNVDIYEFNNPVKELITLIFYKRC